jgi:hypothetical protein
MTLRMAARLGLVCWTLLCLSALGAEPKRVLLIHSFGRDFAPFNTFSGNFRTELARQSTDPIDGYEVSLESARFSPDASISPETALEPIHPRDRASVERAVDQARRAGTAFVGEFRVMPPDGTPWWIAARGRCVGWAHRLASRGARGGE